MAGPGRPKKDEVIKQDVKADSCPWCNFDNNDEKIGPAHEKEENTVLEQIGGRYQCNTCGKNWRKADLGKPWSLELERGPAWARENRARELRG